MLIGYLCLVGFQVISFFPPTSYFFILWTFLQQAVCILGLGGGQQNNLEKSKGIHNSDKGLYKTDSNKLPSRKGGDNERRFHSTSMGVGESLHFFFY